MPNEYQEASLPGQADKDFGRLVGEYSKGRIKVVHHFGGALGYKSRDHFAAVEDGAVPLASTYAGTFIGMDPIWMYQSVPFLATKSSETRASVNTARPWINRAMGKGGQFMLMAEPWTPVGIWANKPITSIAALKSLKIRTYDANSTEAMRAAGASPVQLSWADVIPALATGTIDSVITSDEGGVSAKFWEHLSHGGIMHHARRPGGPVAAAQNCATHGPLSVATRGRRCTAWSSMRRFDWRLSTRV